MADIVDVEAQCEEKAIARDDSWSFREMNDRGLNHAWKVKPLVAGAW